MSLPLTAYVTQVRRVLWITLAVNLIVVGVKLGIGLSSSSLAVLSDAAHSSVDSLNNLMGLLLMSRVRPYADTEHPYGHTKFEVVGALGIAAFMLLTCYEIFSRAIGRLFTDAPSDLHVSTLTVVIFGLTLLGNLLVIWYERREGKRLQSQFLLADVRHTQSDVYVTLGIIIGLIFVALGFPRMDALVSVMVAVLVAFSGYRVVRDALPVLVDQAVHDLEEIKEVAKQIPGVAEAHTVRTRGAGQGCFIELDIHVRTQSLPEAHEVAEHVEQALRDRFGPDCTVTVHMEPDGEAGDQQAS